MSDDNISPQDVKALLDSGEDCVVLDVRSREEVAFGHIEGSVNIPVMVTNHYMGGTMPNDNFLSDCEEQVDKEARIITVCREGVRSARARDLMAGFGYDNVSSMVGGIEGSDRGGEVIEGWRQLGYPVKSV